jgi:hypothetical protein
MEVERDRGDGDHGAFDVEKETREPTGHPEMVDRRVVWKAALREYGPIPPGALPDHV